MMILLMSAAPSALAFNHTDFLSLLSSSWVATLSGGAQLWEQAGSAQTLNLAPEIEKTYTANQSL